MVRKTCPACGKDSYSVGEGYRWICPYCGRDLTKVPAEPTGARRSIKKEGNIDETNQYGKQD